MAQPVAVRDLTSALSRKNEDIKKFRSINESQRAEIARLRKLLGRLAENIEDDTLRAQCYEEAAAEL